MKSVIRILPGQVLAMMVLMFLAGCSVSPWERGNLAREEMLPNPDPALSTMRAHVFESKEAASGGQGGVGGGCGCN